ncbi:hypothetical protein K4K61_006049 [Colletotrichum sp. SAR11_59]|nr:hypothetical protein K4K61_006049 [Colletotrichum sp. SAR11_59]
MEGGPHVAEGRADEAFEVFVKIRQRTRNDPEILAEFQQIKQTIELERQLSQRDSWKSLVSPEILKYNQRARGVGVGQALGYLVGAGLSYAIPFASQNLSWRYYILNCLWNVPIFVVICWLFPETKGRTLEEINSIFDGSIAKSSLQVIEGQPDPFIEDGHHEVRLKELKDSLVGTSAQ